MRVPAAFIRIRLRLGEFGEELIGNLLGGSPVAFGLLTAGVTGGINWFVPERIVPQPLAGLRALATLVIFVAAIAGYAWRARLRQLRRHFAAATAGALAVLVLLHLLLVEEVRYGTGGESGGIHSEWFLTGWRVVDPELVGLSPDFMIRSVGDGASDMRAIWGGSFTASAVLYTLVYLAMINGLVLTLAGLQAGRRSRSLRSADGSGIELVVATRGRGGGVGADG